MRTLRASLVCFVLMGSAAAEDVNDGKAGHEWSRVEAIPAGTLVHVKAPHGGLCRVASVEAEVLRCESSGSVPKTYARSEVRQIALSKRGTSAGVMAGIGAGTGIAVTAVLSKAFGYGGQAKPGAWAAGVGIGAAIFAPIGFASDPFRGPVVYTAR